MKKRKIIEYTIITLILILSNRLCSGNEVNIEEKYNLAIEIRQVDFYKAETLFKEIVLTYPKSKYAGLSFENIALVYSRNGWHRELIEFYEIAKSKDVLFTDDSLLVLTGSFVFYEQYDYALSIFKNIKVDNLREEHVLDYYYGAIMCSIETGSRENEEKYIKNFLYYHPHEYMIYYTAFYLHMKNGNIDDAITNLQKYCEVLISKENITQNDLHNILHVNNIFIGLEQYELIYLNLLKLRPLISNSSEYYEEFMYMLGIAAFDREDNRLSIELLTYVVDNTDKQKIKEISKDLINELYLREQLN